MGYIPDATDLYEQYEAEQERMKRRRSREAAEFDRVEYEINLEEEAS